MRGILLLLLLLPSLASAQILAEKQWRILYSGDSISNGSDDETIPPDNDSSDLGDFRLGYDNQCASPPPSCNNAGPVHPLNRYKLAGGTPGLLRAHGGQNSSELGGVGFGSEPLCSVSCANHAGGGGAGAGDGVCCWPNILEPDPNPANIRQWLGPWIFFTELETNDGCGVCTTGGTSAVCWDDASCEANGPCTDVGGTRPYIETKNNIREAIDQMQAKYSAGEMPLWIYAKTPAVVGRGDYGGLHLGFCAQDKWDRADPLALPELFLVDKASDPRTIYTEDIYRRFSTIPAGETTQPEEWWFAMDPTSGGTSSTAIHPNGFGYAEIAHSVCEMLAEYLQDSPLARRTGQPVTYRAFPTDEWIWDDVARCNTRPNKPVVTPVSETSNTITVSVTIPTDPDGDPVRVFVKTVESGRWLGDLEAGQHLGTHDGIGPEYLAQQGGTPQGFPTAPDWYEVPGGGGQVVLEGLTAATSYQVGAFAWDGFQGSYPGTLDRSTSP